MSRQFATNVTTIYDIFCPVPLLPSPFGFRRFKRAPYRGLAKGIGRKGFPLGFRGPATGVIWALRAQSWKKSPRMSCRGLSAPGSKKSKTESKKSQNSIVFQLFWLFFDSGFDFLGFRAERPRELIFGLFFQLWAQRAQMTVTPVAGTSFRKVSLICSNSFWKQIGRNRNKLEQIGTNASKQGTQLGTNRKKTGKSEQIGTNRGDPLLPTFWAHIPDCLSLLVVGKWLSKPPSTTINH